MFTYCPDIKRFFDFVLSVIALSLLSPFFILICIVIPLDSKGFPFFLQKRIGREMNPFTLIKFRSMIYASGKKIKQFDPGDDRRVTRIGRFLRITKLDELPELINILLGQMSIVGPRPEVPKYVDMYYKEFSEILINRPGLTDFASIKFRNEAALLAKQPDPDKYYCNTILKEKLELARQYSNSVSFKTDLNIIVNTFVVLFMGSYRK